MKTLQLAVLCAVACLLLALAASQRTTRIRKTTKSTMVTTAGRMRQQSSTSKPKTMKPKLPVLATSRKVPVTTRRTTTIATSTTQEPEEIGDSEYEMDMMRVGPLAKSRAPIRSSQRDGTVCGQCTLFTASVVELDCYGLGVNQEQFAASYAQCQDSLASVKVLYLGANSLGDIQNSGLLQPFTALEQVYMTDSDISSLDSDSFLSTPSLQVLDLRGNTISTLTSDVFEKLPNLRVLRLGNNALRGINSQVFAPLTSLTELDLSANGIQDTTDWNFQANSQLTVLDLSGNRLKQIGQEVLGLASLKVVNLGNNQLTQTVVENLQWYPNASLNVLDLTACGLTSVPKKLPSSVDLLILSRNKITRLDQAQLQSTRSFGPFSLRLDNNNLATIPVEAFQNAFNIIGLDVSYNLLSAVPRLLPRNLIHLNISNNFINATFAQLTASSPYLAYLNLSNNRIIALRTGVLNTTQVYDIDLSNNLIASVERMSIQNMPHLRRLLLRNNPISKVARFAFGDLPRLAELDLGGCTGKTLQLVNPVFRDLDSLRVLNVSNCPLMCNNTVFHIESLANPDYDAALNTARLSSSSRLDRIRQLDLSSCQFRSISTKFLDLVANNLSDCYYLYLQDNPWHCDVYFWSIIEKLRNMTNKLYNFGDLKCASPPALRGKPLLWLSVNEILAANPQQWRDAAILGLFVTDEYPPDCRCGDCGCSPDCACEVVGTPTDETENQFRSARGRVLRKR